MFFKAFIGNRLHRLCRRDERASTGISLEVRDADDALMLRAGLETH